MDIQTCVQHMVLINQLDKPEITSILVLSLSFIKYLYITRKSSIVVIMVSVGGIFFPGWKTKKLFSLDINLNTTCYSFLKYPFHKDRDENLFL